MAGLCFVAMAFTTTPSLWAQGYLPTTDEAAVDEVAPVPGDPVEIWDGDEQLERGENPGTSVNAQRPVEQNINGSKSNTNQKPSMLRKNFWDRLSH